MNINDYLIDQSGKDWSVLLRDWMPPLVVTQYCSRAPIRWLVHVDLGHTGWTTRWRM